MLTLKQHGEPGRDCLVFRLVDAEGIVRHNSTDLASSFSWLWTNGDRYINVPTKGKALIFRLLKHTPAPRGVR